MEENVVLSIALAFIAIVIVSIVAGIIGLIQWCSYQFGYIDLAKHNTWVISVSLCFTVFVIYYLKEIIRMRKSKLEVKETNDTT